MTIRDNDEMARWTHTDSTHLNSRCFRRASRCNANQVGHLVGSDSVPSVCVQCKVAMNSWRLHLHCHAKMKWRTTCSWTKETLQFQSFKFGHELLTEFHSRQSAPCENSVSRRPKKPSKLWAKQTCLFKS